MRLRILRTGLLVLVSLLFARPITAQDEADQLLDLLANPPKDGLLIIEIDTPAFSVDLYYLVINVSTGKYYYLNRIIPWCIDEMPSSYKGKLIVSANCEGIPTYYLLEDGQVKELSMLTDSEIRIGSEVTWTPDGNLSFVDTSWKDGHWNTDIYVWNGTIIRNSIHNEARHVYGLTWSSDGRLAFGAGDPDSDTDIMVWDGTRTQTIWQPNHDEDYELAWSSNGRLAIESEGDIYVWDGTEVLEISNTAYADFSDWSSDGKLAFQAYQDGQADIYVWDGQQAIKVFENPGDDKFAVWGPDNQLFFMSFSDKDYKISTHIWENGVLSQPLPQDVYPPVAWNPDGRLAFATRPDPYHFEIYVWDGQRISFVTTFSSGTFREIMWVDAP